MPSTACSSLNQIQDCEEFQIVARGLLTAILSAMINSQDFDALPLHAIDSGVGQRRKWELAGSFLASDTATMWPLFQGLDCGIHFAQGRLLIMRMMLFEVIAEVL
jgi:hypothetical protein